MAMIEQVFREGKSPASWMPLVHTTPVDWIFDAFKDKNQDSLFYHVSKKGSRCWDVQEKCGWMPAVYMYAGKAGRPDRNKAEKRAIGRDEVYGELIMLCYHPEIEREKDGCATPCDSGGVFTGNCKPFPVESEDKERFKAVKFLQETRMELDQWRAGFHEYLWSFYGSEWQNYMDGDKPASCPELKDACWDHCDLPVRYVDKLSDDWASWTWEVRLTGPKPISVTDALLGWAMPKETYRKVLGALALWKEAYVRGEEGVSEPPELPDGFLDYGADPEQGVRDFMKNWIEKKQGGMR
ncbi:MAG: hypothetical protein HQL54_05880 [Magnetococcales bacterium]|nr:hypothetical protein [Magnetococcales bacterium]